MTTTLTNAERRLTVGRLKMILSDLPDDLPITVETPCTEMCGTMSDGAETARIDRCTWDSKWRYNEDGSKTYVEAPDSLFISSVREP